MSYQRRDFLKLAAALGSGVVLNGLAGCAGAKGNAAGRPIGLQLYTLRGELPRDPRGVLRQVASFGYNQIESYEGAQGMFWGMSNTEFKRYMDELGMQIVSSHCNVDQNFERKAAEAAAIGMKYLIAPYLGPQKTLDDYKRAADKYNNRGEICKKAGIRFAYHNHDYTFVPVEGQFPQDVLMQNTDKDLVDYEMDIYWVVTAGQDPVTWFKKYPNRFRLSHIKDRKRNAAPTEKEVSVVLGTGGTNYSEILNVGRKNGLQYYIIEQEAYEGTTPLAAARANAENLKQLKF